MRNIFFSQIAVSSYKYTLYLPYTAGCLITYALQDEEIAQNYAFNDVLFLREEIDAALARIYDPYLVAFSCSVGNIEYSRLLAQKVKRKYPSCRIVFGGHGVSTGTSFLVENDFVDFAVFGEGEQAFSALLKALLHDTGFEGINNLSYRTSEGVVTNTVYMNQDIRNYPSPYQTGFFDGYFEKYPEVEFHAIIETNRGCPFQCAFCEWCFTENIRLFPLERVQKDIDWMTEKRIEYCYCADANFGIAPRDLDIAAYVVESRKKNGYPAIFRPTYSKNSNETVFEAGKLLNKNGADKGVTIAYQTLNEKTLENIGRKEMDMDFFSRLQQRYSAEGIPSYTEIILGLPGETYNSFCNGLCRLLEAGQHNSLAVYQCQIYTNALMGKPEYQKKHGIKTARVPINSAHYVSDPNGITEYYEVVTATADMSAEEWVRANIFSVVLQAFHSMGLLRCFSMYCYYEQNIPYYDFFHRLMAYIDSADGTFLQSLFNDFTRRFEDKENGVWVYTDKKFGGIGWYFEEGAFLELIYDWETFWKEILPFLEQFELPQTLFEDMLNYQQFIIRRPGVSERQTRMFSHDFFAYYERIYRGEHTPLEARSNRVTLQTKIIADSWEEYAPKIVLGGKRRGETLYTNEKNAVMVTYTLP